MNTSGGVLLDVPDRVDPTRLAWRASPAGYGAHFDPTYKRPRHVNFIAAAFRKAALAAARGQGSNTILSIPPRHSKSETISHWSPVWALDLFPHWKIMLGSYEAGFASEWGYKVRESIIENQGELQVRVAKGMSARRAWFTTAGGGMFTAGVGGPFTGRGAHCFIIDDPFKNFDDASSVNYQEKVWNWYRSTAFTRLEPNGFVFVVMCMTGDTPVLRPDGSETPLRDIRPGDEIATYEDGRLSTSRVVKWANQGHDDVFEIRMESGRVVRANARHPFLTVDENGCESWQRTDELKPGSRILTASGGSGAACSAQQKTAIEPSAARDCARGTTTRLDGQQASDRRQTLSRSAEPLASSIATDSRPTSTTLWLPSRTGAAPSVERFPKPETRPLIGRGSCASITITTPRRCAGCSVTTAISSSRDTSRLSDCAPPLTTWSVTPDRVIAVVPAGREDVFDMQVERTENFIANGLVSHNTRWHEDDLVGKLLQAQEEGADEWTVLNLAALAESKGDLLGRREGEALWPERYDSDRLLRAKKVVGSYLWAGMYQQHPAPLEGSIFKRSWWQWYTSRPATHRFDEIIQSWDMSFKDTKSSDFVCGQVWGRIGADKFLLDQVHERLAFPDTMRAVQNMTAKWPTATLKLIEDTANGPAVIATLKRKITGLVPVSTEGKSKPARAIAVSPQVEAGNVFLPSPEIASWVDDYVDELATFPNAAHDDRVDATSQALHRLDVPQLEDDEYHDERLSNRR